MEKKKNGRQLSEDNIESFRAWVASKSDDDFKGYEFHGQLSRTEIAKECGFGKPQLFILDDLGLTAFTQEQTEAFYEIVAERHQAGNIIITSNRPPGDWPGLFPDQYWQTRSWTDWHTRHATSRSRENHTGREDGLSILQQPKGIPVGR